MLRASWHEQGGMREYACKCGFTSGSATTFFRHLRRFKDDRNAHHMLVSGNKVKEEPQAVDTQSGPVDSAADPVALGSADSPREEEQALPNRPATAGRSVFERLSFVGGLGSLWGTTLHAPGPASKPEEIAEDSSVEGISDEDSDYEPTPNEEILHSDSTWEPDTEEYADITRSLQASGESGLNKDGEEHPSWLSGSVSRMLGSWSRASDADSPQADVAIVEEESPAGTSGNSHVSQLLPTLQQKVSIEDLEALLLWTDPLLTAKVAGGGAYALICIRHLVNGVEIIQPSTVLAVTSICLMLYNSVRTAWRQRRHPLQRANQRAAEGALQQRVEELVTGVILRILPVLSAAVSLIARRLSEHSTKGSRVWLGCCLWLVVCVGELGWLSQSTLALWLWVSLFTLPGVYLTCRAALDALVEECFTFLLSALRGGQRSVLLASAFLGLLTFVLVDAKIFTRVSLAAVSSGGVLFWQAHRMKQAKRATVTSQGANRRNVLT